MKKTANKTIIHSAAIQYSNDYGYWGWEEIYILDGKKFKVKARFDNGVTEVVGSVWSSTNDQWNSAYHLPSKDCKCKEAVSRIYACKAQIPVRKDFAADLDKVTNIIEQIAL